MRLHKILKIGSPYSGEALYWSNKDGWGDFASAEKYLFASRIERENAALPMDGQWVQVPQRFSDAYNIQQGACNPAGIARSLVNACDECLAEGVQQRADPAVRLIVHQLAFLVGTTEIDSGLSTYTDLYDKCREINDDPQKGLFIPD